MDANLLHISYEGNALEDPWQEPDESMFTRSVSPEDVSEGEGGTHTRPGGGRDREGFVGAGRVSLGAER